MIADLLDRRGMALDVFQLRTRSLGFPDKHIVLGLRPYIIKPREDIEFVLARRNLWLNLAFLRLKNSLLNT